MWNAHHDRSCIAYAPPAALSASDFPKFVYHWNFDMETQTVLYEIRNDGKILYHSIL